MIDYNVLNLIDNKEIIKVVQDLVKMPSINPPGDEQETADYIVNYMNAKGIVTNIQNISPTRYNVVSRLKGNGARKPTIFTGHMDVVPVSKDERARWRMDPFSGKIIDDYLYGRGSADMKGGLGAAMVAMGLLADNKIVPPGDIILVATVDEEDVMRGAKALITSALIADADRFVVCETTNMKINTCSKGRTWAKVTVYGQIAHASIRDAGINAINRMVTLINCMKEHIIPCNKHELLGDSFWQVTLIEGGIEPAIIPDSCSIIVDARLVPGQTPDGLWDELRKVIEKIKMDIPDFQANINVIEKRESWEVDRNDKLVHIVEAACKSIDLPIEYSGFMGTTDGTVFRRMGIEGLIMGPGQLEKNIHQENEKVAIKQLFEATQVYLLTMLTE